jgi:hypothetical protein
MRHACLLVAALMCAAVPSFCQKSDMSASGNQFLATCGDVPDMVHLTEMGFGCAAYVDGLMGGIALFADKGGILEREQYCSPSGVTVGQAVRLLVKYIKDNPAIAHVETRMLMLSALVAAFPCPPAPPVKTTPPAKK